MSSIVRPSVTIQTSPEPVPAVPAWFGEVAIVAHYLTHLGTLTAINDTVRFARKRFGTFEVIDFVAVLIGYALSGEPTLTAYYERLRPVCAPGYTGRKRGEVVRTRTTLLQLHTHQWLGIFGNPGNGDYRGELLRGLDARDVFDCGELPVTPEGHRCRVIITTHPVLRS